MKSKLLEINNFKVKSDLNEILDIILAEITKNIRPSDRMISFYNFVGRFPRALGIPLLLLTSVDAWKVVILAGIFNRTDAALQTIYNHKVRPWRLFWAIGDALWQGAYNCRSVRARALFVKELVPLLIFEIQNLVNFSRRPIVASIGSGSAIQLFQSLFNNSLNKSCHLILVDRDHRALKRGRKNASFFDIESADFQKTTIGSFLKRSPESSIDLIEMVGLTDYFENKHLERYFKKINHVLSPSGFFIGANISNNEESDYAHGVVCWPHMFYRSNLEIIDLLKSSGFKKIWTGECGLYTFWIAQKSSL